jgi:hypothetical protein
MAQDIETLKKSDSIYIYYDGNAGQMKESQMNKTGKSVGVYYHYNVARKDVGRVTFSHMDVNDGEACITRAAYRKNIPQMVTFDFLKNLSFRELGEIFNGKKVFLIEKKDSKKRKVKAKAVRMQTSVLYEM